MLNKKEILSAVAGTLCRAESVAICGHVMPDGDCLGSVLALGRALQKMGKSVVMLSPDPVPEMYSFLPGVKDIKLSDNGHTEYDVFVSVDCSVPERLGGIKTILARARKVIVLDHHAGATVFGHLYLNESNFAAAGEVIYDLLQILPVEIDTKMAACLYVAIVTDTGSFRYDNTGPETHLRIAELMKLGVESAQINKLLYEENPLVSIKILGDVLQTLTISDCGRVAWLTVSREMLNKFHARDEHVDGVINYPRMIRGIELALVYRELEKDKYKVSLRSKYYLDVNKLAAHFGGGGHARAAGCIVEGDLTKIQQRMLNKALNALKDENS